MTIRLHLPFLLLLLQTATAQQYNFLTYSVGEGLPQSQVFAVMQDSRGYLWSGTQGGGLSRFDGLDFETFTTENGLLSNYINALFEDSDGQIWIGTNTGICRYDGHSFHAITNEKSPFSAAYDICEKTKGRLWLGTEKGIFEWDKNTNALSKIALPSMPERTAVLAFRMVKENTWIGTNRGVWVSGKQTVRLSTRDGLAGDNITAFTTDRQGQIWMANWPNGLTVVDPAQNKVVRTITLPHVERAICLFAAVDGKIWVGTQDKGIQIYNPADSTWEEISEKQGLPHNHIRVILSDNTGNIWVATSGGGLVKFLTQSFIHYSKEKGLLGNRVYAVAEDHQGRIWLAASQFGLQVLDSSGLQPYALDSGYLTGVKCKTLATDALGRLWAGTEGRGIAVLSDSMVTAYITTVGGLPSNRIQKIVRGESGVMWAAMSTGGIARLSYSAKVSPTVDKVYGLQDGLPDLQITTLQADWKKRIWFATQSGKVGYIEAGKVAAVFDQAAGLPGVLIRCLAFNELNDLWIGTKGAGVYWADTGGGEYRFQPAPTTKKLTSQNIYVLVFDKAGNLWAGSENGVDKLIFNNSQITDVQHFGKNEGFIGIETCHDAAVCDLAGNLWFGTMNGLTKHIPTEAKAIVVPPVIHFKNVSLYYKPLRETPFATWLSPSGGLLDGLELPYDQNHLSFEFKAVDLANSRQVRYHWWLEGAEADWSPLTTQQSINYANLSPGRYTFWVQACADSACSEPVKASFSIKAPFWQELWFQLALGLTLLGSVLLLVKSRIRHIRKTEQAKREKLEMQHHLLQLEQKALQLQMNPHFIFNALNSIQSLVSTGDSAGARQELSAFARLMRSILNNSRKQTISLQEETDTLEQYLRIEQFCQQNKFDFAIHLPGNVDAAEIELPPMLLQPFVENAVVHGVSHLQYPGKIEVHFKLIRDRVAAGDKSDRVTGSHPVTTSILECEIRDNGIGREKAALLRQERKPGHTSVAVEVTRERLEALKNGFQYTPLEYEDLLDAENKITGTQVTVRLPATINY